MKWPRLRQSGPHSIPVPMIDASASATVVAASSGSTKPADTDAETAKTTVATAPDEAETEEVKGFKLFAIMAALTLVCFLMLLDMSIIATVRPFGRNQVSIDDANQTQAIPRITTEFHSLRDVGWYGSAYQLARYVDSRLFSGNV